MHEGDTLPHPETNSKAADTSIERYNALAGHRQQQGCQQKGMAKGKLPVCSKRVDGIAIGKRHSVKLKGKLTW